LTAYNVDQLDRIFNVIENEGIDRVCFYHLAYAGRGDDIREADLSPLQRRDALDTIFRRTREAHKKDRSLEVLTVANPVDNVYLFKKLLNEDPERAKRVKNQLEWNGGGLNSSGVGIASIDFYGRVHPNQFWMNRTLGNVKNRSFPDIWSDDSNSFLNNLRDKKQTLKDPCSSCRFLNICGGGLRLRAEAEGDRWGQDPSCYLTDQERSRPDFFESRQTLKEKI
jgi:radical SAM protein with 4Fe4S-binding SPASM domain